MQAAYSSTSDISSDSAAVLELVCASEAAVAAFLVRSATSRCSHGRMVAAREVLVLNGRRRGQGCRARHC
jgi:hypothetical protein